jgi:hypothetical protein
MTLNKGRTPEIELPLLSIPFSSLLDLPKSEYRIAVFKNEQLGVNISGINKLIINPL